MSTPRPTDSELFLGAFTYLVGSPGWVWQCVKAGLFALIPILGPLAMLGWERDIFEARVRGEPTLPPYRFAPGRGIVPFLAGLNAVILALPAVLLIFSVLALVAVAGGVIGEERAMPLLLLLIPAVLIAALLVLPAAFFSFELQRAGAAGDPLPILRLGACWQNIRHDPVGAIITYAGVYLTQLIGALGVSACYVGLLLTLPARYALRGAILAGWELRVRAAAD